MGANQWFALHQNADLLKFLSEDDITFKWKEIDLLDSLSSPTDVARGTLSCFVVVHRLRRNRIYSNF